MRKAENFFNKSGILHHPAQRAVSVRVHDFEGTVENEPYYIFNAAGEKGFVIIAGDDRVPAILGYSDTGTLNADDIPSNMQWLLDYYRDAISGLPQDYVSPARASRSPKNDIPALIKTKWGQWSPYNDKCPESTDGSEFPTGCVTTAMAQVVNYHKWPIKKVIPVSPYSYIDYNGDNVSLPGLPSTIFDWDNMTDESIARLMQYCGYSLKIRYEPWGSGTFMSNTIPALIGVFGFSGDVRDVYRSGFSDEEWLDMAYNELDMGRPLIYQGEGSSVGHCFVVDGYSGEYELFHVNWGWEGVGDGYFSLDNLIVGDGNYSYNQGMILNVYPPEKFDAEKSVLEYEFLPEDLIAKVKGYKGTPENIDVPGVIRIEDQSYRVASIGNSVFAGCESLKSIHFSPGISSIDRDAFKNCKNLTLVEFPDGLSSIGEFAFENCSGMYGHLTFPASVMRINKGAFKGCTNLTILIFASESDLFGQVLEEQSFMNCENLYYVSCDFSHFTEIKAETFKGCGLVRFSCPNTVTKIGNSAFEGCDALERIEIYDKVTEIGDKALAGCTSLTMLHCEAITPPVCGTAAFDGIDKEICMLNVPASSIPSYKEADQWCDFNPRCEELKYEITSDNEVKLSGYYFNPVDLIIPGQTEIDGKTYKVSELGGSCFCWCESLRTVSIPNTVTAIGVNAFAVCSNLSSVNIPESVATIGLGAFQFCRELTDLTLPASVAVIEEYTFYFCDRLLIIAIPESVTAIRPFAFSNCLSASLIWLPASVTEIGECAFTYCNGLQKIYVAAQTPPDIEEHSFTNYSATLYVPEESVDEYRNHPVWSRFDNIEGFDVNGIEDVSVDSGLIEESTDVVAYNLCGSPVYKGVFGALRDYVSPGVYLVRSATTTKKIVVK